MWFLLLKTVPSFRYPGIAAAILICQHSYVLLNVSYHLMPQQRQWVFLFIGSDTFRLWLFQLFDIARRYSFRFSILVAPLEAFRLDLISHCTKATCWFRICAIIDALSFRFSGIAAAILICLWNFICLSQVVCYNLIFLCRSGDIVYSDHGSVVSEECAWWKAGKDQHSLVVVESLAIFPTSWTSLKPRSQYVLFL